MWALAQQTARSATHPSSIRYNKSSASCNSFVCANDTHGARTDVGKCRDCGGRRTRPSDSSRAYFSATRQSKLQGRTIKSRVHGMLLSSASRLFPATIPIMPNKVVETPYPLIDADPHASRVIGYFRPSDYAAWAAATAAFPAALYFWGMRVQFNYVTLLRF